MPDEIVQTFIDDFMAADDVATARTALGLGTAATTAATAYATAAQGATADSALQPNGNGSGLTALNASELGSGIIPDARMPNLTGDITTVEGNVATTLATVNANVGSFTNANITVNAKGLITAAANGTGGSGSGKILQVVQATKTDTASVTGQSFTSVFTGSITPTADTSRILILGMLNLGGSGNFPCIRLMRAATQVLQGDAAGSRSRVITQTSTSGTNPMVNAVIAVVDSPATAAAITYEIELASQTTGTVYLNRSNADTDSSSFCRGASTLIFLEIGA